MRDTVGYFTDFEFMCQQIKICQLISNLPFDIYNIHTFKLLNLKLKLFSQPWIKSLKCDETRQFSSFIYLEIYWLDDIKRQWSSTLKN